jgi:hypothetical protein
MDPYNLPKYPDRVRLAYQQHVEKLLAFDNLSENAGFPELGKQTEVYKRVQRDYDYIRSIVDTIEFREICDSRMS